MRLWFWAVQRGRQLEKQQSFDARPRVRAFQIFRFAAGTSKLGGSTNPRKGTSTWWSTAETNVQLKLFLWQSQFLFESSRCKPVSDCKTQGKKPCAPMSEVVASRSQQRRPAAKPEHPGFRVYAFKSRFIGGIEKSRFFKRFSKSTLWDSEETCFVYKPRMFLSSATRSSYA